MREAGILLHISSLFGDYGIGTFGSEAFEFAKFLADSGCRLWQILPVGPTGYGDSPYQSLSSFAGNPYFISPEILAREGLLSDSEAAKARRQNDGSVDYGWLWETRMKLFSRGVTRFYSAENPKYDEFCRRNRDWLDDYCLFAAIRDENPKIPFQNWDSALKFREPGALDGAKTEFARGIALHRMLQFLFFEQYSRLKNFCRGLGVGILGDLPIYVSSDSADVWADPKQFVLNSELFPSELSGCPPDDFSESGQRWGNPLYNWEYMVFSGYEFWKKRLSHSLAVFDCLRIDHFRGFDSYYCLPCDGSAAFGVWRKGPGIGFFREVSGGNPSSLPLIAEDLGYLTDSVRKLLADTGYPGMKVLEFGFTEGGEEYLPHNYRTGNSVAYTGTHDNPTLAEFFASLSPESRRRAAEYLGVGERIGELVTGGIRAVLASVCDRAVIPMQDLLGIGAEGRMNTPASTSGNWRWRMKSPPSKALCRRLRRSLRLYGR